MALAFTSGFSRTCAVSGLVTHYTYAHYHRNLRKEALYSTRSDRINNNNNNNNNNNIFDSVDKAEPSAELRKLHNDERCNLHSKKYL
jgi:hypothetical protein